MINQAIADLVEYALDTGLVEEADRVWAVNGLLEDLGLSDWEEVPGRRGPWRRSWAKFWTGPWPRAASRTAPPAGISLTRSSWAA